MSQFVSNSAARRNQIIRFSGLFLLTVILASFVFLRLFYVKTEIPKQELEQSKELAPILDRLVDYGEDLYAYEQAIISNPVQAPKLQSAAKNTSVEIHGMLMNAEQNPGHPKMNDILLMGDRFFNSLNETEGKFLALQKEMDDCKDDMEDLEDDLKDCKEKMEKCKKW